MEHLLRPIYQERAGDPDTLAVLLVEKRGKLDPVTDTFDAILLIIAKHAGRPVYTKHYTDGEEKAAMHIISEQQLKKWLLLGTNPKIVDWLLFGRVLFDRNEYIETVKQELKEFPFYGRQIKMGLEFARLIRHYMEGKMFFEQQNFLDAYNDVIRSLHGLARLSVIDNGLFPEVTVWSQVKKIEPAIYKLYEELITSDEAIEKRLELLFLAGEFFIHSRTEDGARHILSVMSERPVWTIQELHEQEELRNYSADLEVFVEYLIDKGYIEVVLDPAKDGRIDHRYYRVSDGEN
ncbi:nucleotidyltransferase-like protein [Bhargavaea cecembensis]|uniref:nucleotidyltransferase-like protein n=1 Tax=Bhargavaea cecembensis TaxID=394098 RepID=UPI00058BF66A|nr:nucleotidyltransferase-like protein [Bhargavaea cecembensis]